MGSKVDQKMLTIIKMFDLKDGQNWFRWDDVTVVVEGKYCAIQVGGAKEGLLFGWII